MWAIGDVVLTFQSRGGVEPPTPSLADVFYLGFFPLTYVAVVLFMRGRSGSWRPPAGWTVRWPVPARQQPARHSRFTAC